MSARLTVKVIRFDELLLVNEPGETIDHVPVQRSSANCGELPAYQRIR
jgi:hypothetical protein